MMARTAYSYVRFVNRKAARTEDIAGRFVRAAHAGQPAAVGGRPGTTG